MNATKFASYIDDDDPLGFEIIVQRLGTMFPADAAGFHSAERKLVIAVVERVHPDVPRLKLFDRFVGVQQISRPDRRAQAEFRRIRLFESFVERSEERR